MRNTLSLLLFSVCFSVAVLSQTSAKDTAVVYGPSEVEIQPTFPGGMDSMSVFFKRNLHYPDSAKAKGIQGKAFVQFIVMRNGSLHDISLVKGVGDCPECDKNALDLVKKFPRWNPGQFNGQALKVKMVIPVSFKLMDQPAYYNAKDVDKEAHFPGGDSAMYAFINSNIHFPDSSQRRNTAAGTYLAFIVDRNGNMKDLQAVKEGSKCPECDDEVIRVVKTFPKWVPAEKNGMQVNQRVLLPITYVLKTENLGAHAFSLQELGTQPEFPGGFAELMKFLQKNIKYPVKERDNGIQGKVFVGFVVSTEGEVKHIVILKGVTGGEGLDKEAMRVVGLMPKWTPGTINGKPVDVLYNLPIKFELGEGPSPTPVHHH